MRIAFSRSATGHFIRSPLGAREVAGPNGSQNVFARRFAAFAPRNGFRALYFDPALTWLQSAQLSRRLWKNKDFDIDHLYDGSGDIGYHSRVERFTADNSGLEYVGDNFNAAQQPQAGSNGTINLFYTPPVPDAGYSILEIDRLRYDYHDAVTGAIYNTARISLSNEINFEGERDGLVDAVNGFGYRFLTSGLGLDLETHKLKYLDASSPGVVFIQFNPDGMGLDISPFTMTDFDSSLHQLQGRYGLHYPPDIPNDAGYRFNIGDTLNPNSANQFHPTGEYAAGWISSDTFQVAQAIEISVLVPQQGWIGEAEIHQTQSGASILAASVFSASLPFHNMTYPLRVNSPSDASFPADTGSALGVGRVRFVIFNETPAQWSARTGIPVS